MQMVGITTQPRMRPITWNPRAGRGCLQDDGLADNRQGIKWVTVQRRVFIAPEMKPSLKAFQLGGVYHQQSVAKRTEYRHRLFMARSRSRAARKLSAADEEASTLGAAGFVGTTVLASLGAL